MDQVRSPLDAVDFGMVFVGAMMVDTRWELIVNELRDVVCACVFGRSRIVSHEWRYFPTRQEG